MGKGQTGASKMCNHSHYNWEPGEQTSWNSYWNIYIILHLFILLWVCLIFWTWSNVHNDMNCNSQIDWVTGSKSQTSRVAAPNFLGSQVTTCTFFGSQLISSRFRITPTAWKVPKYGLFSGPYFPTFGLNTERYEESLRFQSECGKIRTRKNSVFGHFSCSVQN